MPNSAAYSSAGFSSIGLAKEIESPENPGALEKRVALIPEDVGKLVATGCTVYVEHGAGAGVGFSDDEYQANGAHMQSADQIYRDKDLIIKFKGPALASIEQMRQGCTLFCMAHFHSYPERARLLSDRHINVVAMEEIAESPKSNPDEAILGRTSMTAALAPFFESNTIGGLRVRVIGWSERLRGAIRRCGNRNPRSLKVIHPSLSYEELDATGENALYFYDGQSFNDPNSILGQLAAAGTPVFDMHAFEKQHGAAAIHTYRESHPPNKFGLRRIQCLHETGQAGARHGVNLLRANKPALDLANAKAVILGYGNVAQGALDELHQHGIKNIHILGRSQTAKGRIDFWLKGADLLINGAEQAPELRGVNFLISNQHVKDLIPDGSVIIDLVGGSASNRSPVEPVISCSFLTQPNFEQDGVTISSLWGWPMLGMMRETAVRYSGQILDVLTGPEKLIKGLDTLAPGVERALVCGPFCGPFTD